MEGERRILCGGALKCQRMIESEGHAAMIIEDDRVRAPCGYRLIVSEHLRL
jgi:hypothetical protein